jgi:LysR family hydrogen peroxide-inducible transcriptional activator
MVAGGAGVTLLPRLALPFEQSRAELSVRGVSDPVPRRAIVIAWRPRSFLADALRQIAATIRGAHRAPPTSPGPSSPPHRRRPASALAAVAERRRAGSVRGARRAVGAGRKSAEA